MVVISLLLHGNIDQTLMNALQFILYFEIGGLECRYYN